ncbi:hypothetisches protein [mine drainage metagenome]|uniref:Hypothetisches protein n=1 Tax=mine drainage metagenome TaxID=410659 RepID=A0A1J5QCT1_9ZZZZ
MSIWQLQDAKARLSELLKTAELDGPQEITVHGKPVAVVLSRREYQRLTGMHESLADFMQRSPLHERDEVDFVRDRSPTREIAL